MEAEGGLSLLSDLCLQSGAYQETKDLARQVLDRCQRFRDDPAYDSSDEAPNDILDG